MSQETTRVGNIVSAVSVVGVLLASLTACAAWFAGLPLLGHTIAWEWIVFAVVISGAIAWAVTHLWSRINTPTRVGVITAVLISLTFLIVGVSVNPVVIGGTVYAKGSDKYEQVSFANMLITDLEALGQMDVYLSGNSAQAWNQSGDMQSAQEEAQEMSNKYGKMIKERSVPAGQLVQSAQATMTAAYEMSQAIELRFSILESGTDELNDDITVKRDAFTLQWQAAGQLLGSAAQQLGIPLNVTQGPEET